MRAPKRRFDPGVAQQLLAEPHRFEFFQAMRILEHLFVGQGTTVADAVPRHLRFRNTLSLGFPAAELEAVQAYASDGEPLEKPAAIEHAAATETVGEVHLTPSFMGLLGVSGALPLHYTETLAERETYQRDRAARAFLDIFTTRAVALHYGAWKKHRLAMQYELDRRERFLPLALSLGGLGMDGLRDRMRGGDGEIFDQAAAYYAGAIRQRPVSAAMLRQVLCEYFGVDVQVEQFAGAWYTVPADQRTRLGMANAGLGTTALAGDRVWQRDLRMRLSIGPLDRAAFDDFLPGGSAALALGKWLTLLTGCVLEYEVRLVIRAEDVQPVGFVDGRGGRLGWDSHLCTRPSPTPRSDACYHLHTLH
ncbi:type VI secretion system baseplate subunit TssG [Luteimonas sp. FCS-9]|uniref:type VI secretion system baseplate subunit TssG n=1 Tax=Luteimonas sp. FCS-9 TaxID=1547516 RepID=UPI00063EA6ED|nr:type VI secretion system baseplate subunit TssG [Luteimonas sp. FCS-9]KLJ01992.1 type VI secretion protein [Luteimonas sp. FCS-9]